MRSRSHDIGLHTVIESRRAARAVRGNGVVRAAVGSPRSHGADCNGGRLRPGARDALIENVTVLILAVVACGHDDNHSGLNGSASSLGQWIEVRGLKWCVSHREID